MTGRRPSLRRWMRTTNGSPGRTAGGSTSNSSRPANCGGRRLFTSELSKPSTPPADGVATDVASALKPRAATGEPRRARWAGWAGGGGGGRRRLRGRSGGGRRCGLRRAGVPPGAGVAASRRRAARRLRSQASRASRNMRVASANSLFDRSSSAWLTPASTDRSDQAVTPAASAAARASRIEAAAASACARKALLRRAESSAAAGWRGSSSSRCDSSPEAPAVSPASRRRRACAIDWSSSPPARGCWPGPRSPPRGREPASRRPRPRRPRRRSSCRRARAGPGGPACAPAPA